MSYHNLLKYKNHLGFSMLEMLVAMVILSVGLLAIAGLQTKLISYGANSKENNVAESLAKQKMEQLRRAGFNFLPTPAPGNTSISASDTPSSFNSDFTATFNRTWTISNGPTAANYRLVSVAVSWVNSANITKNVTLFSYITQFDPLDFANLTVPPGLATSPISTITDWKPGGYNYKKDVIVKYKDTNGDTKYYMSNSTHTDDYALTDPGTSSAWSLVDFVQGILQWTPNNTTTHSVCEIRLGDFATTPVKLTDPEVTAFGTKPNGSIDPSAINPAATTRRCSPNMLSGVGILSTQYACAIKAGESKKLFVQCEIEDGSGGTTTMGPIGPYSSSQTGVNLNLCQNSGSCVSSTPAPTAVPTASPVPTATPVATATPIPTATPTASPVSTTTPVATTSPAPTVTPTPAPGATATPIPPATLQITIDMANSNKKDGTSCTIQVLTTGTVCAASSWSTVAVASGSGTAQRNYSTTCTLTGSTANINLQCGNSSTNSYSGWIPLTLTPGNTTTQTFNNF
jgi:type IV pilus modification protein PilV